MSESNNVSDELLAGFVEESLDGLQSLPEKIEAFRTTPSCADPIHAVFRSVHSIKGNAGFFNLTAIKRFAHSLENTLDDVRNDKLTLTEPLARAIVRGFDRLEGMLQSVLEGDLPEELGAEENEILEAVAAASATAAPAEDDLDPAERLLAEALSLAQEMRRAAYPDAAKWAQRLEQAAGDAGPSDAAEEEQAPAAPKTIPPAAFAATKFVVDGHDVTATFQGVIAPLAGLNGKAMSKTDAAALVVALGEVGACAGTISRPSLQAAAAMAAADLQTLVASPLDLDATLLSIVWDRMASEFAEISAPAAIEPPAAKEPAKDAPKDPAAKDKDASAKVRMLRVREDKIDGFLDEVSSLFLTCERFKDVHARLAGGSPLPALVEEMRQVNVTFQTQTAKLQKAVIALRKVPAEGLLSKFPRMARQLAEKLEKRIDVVVTGADCEIDKSLSEELDAPLTHMIRNVCDHAIELPEDRRAAGKPEAGSLAIRCELTRTSVVLTIVDDGRGIDPVRLRKKVVEKGVMTKAQADALSDQEAVELIFHPGFSTAEKISEVSGRGVGLDVVRTSLREHNGDVKVESVVGQGTTFRLEIPLRQAVVVIEGLVVETSGAQFVVPFTHIREIVEVPAERYKTVQGNPVAVVRGQPYSAVSLSHALKMPSKERAADATVPGVILKGKHGEVCLVVEQVVGQRKIVVNSLQNVLKCTEQVQGVAQMGGGKLALVLNVPELIRRCGQEAGA